MRRGRSPFLALSSHRAHGYGSPDDRELLNPFHRSCRMRSVLGSGDRGAGTTTTPEDSTRAGEHLRYAQSHAGARIECEWPTWFGRRSEESEHATKARWSRGS